MPTATRSSAATPRAHPGTWCPADRKWYRNWAITMLLIEQLEEMDLRWPPATFDVAEERARLESRCPR